MAKILVKVSLNIYWLYNLCEKTSKILTRNQNLVVFTISINEPTTDQSQGSRCSKIKMAATDINNKIAQTSIADYSVYSHAITVIYWENNLDDILRLI